MLYKVPALMLLLMISFNYHIFGKTNKMEKTLKNQDEAHLFNLSYEIIPGNTDELVNKIHELAPLFISSYVQVETDFAQKKPEALSNDFMLKSLASHLENGPDKVNWQLFQEDVTELVTQFFDTMDWKKHSDPQEKHIFVTACNSEGKLLGAIQFLITPDFKGGSIKIGFFGVADLKEKELVEKKLVHSIFAIEPECKRLFLHTRDTYQRIIDQYKLWGFTEFESKLPHWINLEWVLPCTKK
jgi:hypothetical protein